MTEPTREDAEVALLAAVEDDRINGLRGHQLAIAILHVLAENGWLLLLRDTADVTLADAAAAHREWVRGFRQGIVFGQARGGD